MCSVLCVLCMCEANTPIFGFAKDTILLQYMCTQKMTMCKQYTTNNTHHHQHTPITPHTCSLSSGVKPARTSSIPSNLPTRCALLALSPVSITTSYPSPPLGCPSTAPFCSTAMPSLLSWRIGSSNVNTRMRVGVVVVVGVGVGVLGGCCTRTERAPVPDNASVWRQELCVLYGKQVGV